MSDGRAWQGNVKARLYDESISLDNLDATTHMVAEAPPHPRPLAAREVRAGRKGSPQRAMRSM
jgi:hypothetical protein